MNAAETVTASCGWSSNPCPESALDEILGEDKLTDASLGIIFVSDGYDLKKLGQTIAKRFPCPVIGCTTAGEICSSGYQEQGLSVAVLRGVDASVEIIHDLKSFDEEEAESLSERIGAKSLKLADRAVLLTLLDGLCMREEWVSSKLYMATGGVPMIGGSSGDSLTFDNTSVYCDGQFKSGIGCCALVRAPGGIHTFVGHHYQDTGEILVVTKADPENRTIYELNGIPAAEAYAAAIGIKTDDLSKVDELLHPLMLNAGDQMFVRGVRTLLGDGSMQLFCAIEEGVVLHVGKSSGAHKNLEEVIDNACSGVNPQLVLMFDCITRKLETDHMNTREGFATVTSKYPSIGFSTYGELYNGVHVNQTVTGVVFGEQL